MVKVKAPVIVYGRGFFMRFNQYFSFLYLKLYYAVKFAS